MYGYDDTRKNNNTDFMRNFLFLGIYFFHHIINIFNSIIQRNKCPNAEFPISILIN